MTVKPNDVEVGKCFVTTTNQVRRVKNITSDDRIEYESRGGKSSMKWGFGPPLTALPKREKFAADVDHEVRCDWDEDHQ